MRFRTGRLRLAVRHGGKDLGGGTRDCRSVKMFCYRGGGGRAGAVPAGHTVP